MHDLSDMLHDLRAAGWMVAVHNDYRQAGDVHTFWLFTHPAGRYLKAEAPTDEEAVTEVLEAAAKLDLSK